MSSDFFGGLSQMSGQFTVRIKMPESALDGSAKHVKVPLLVGSALGGGELGHGSLGFSSGGGSVE